MKNVNLNTGQFHHENNYKSHPLYYLKNDFIDEKVHLQLTFPNDIEKKLFPKCNKCQDYFIQYLIDNKGYFSKLTLNIRNVQAFKLLDNQTFQDFLLEMQELSLNFENISHTNLRLLLDKIFQLAQNTTKLSLFISKCENDHSDIPTNLFDNFNNIKALKEFYLNITYSQWSPVQLSHFLRFDIKKIPSNLQKLSLQLLSIKIEDKMLKACFNNLRKVITPSLQEFILNLDYTQGENVFDYLVKPLLQAVNLESIKIKFWQKPLFQDFINFTQQILEKLQKLKKVHLSLNKCFLSIEFINQILDNFQNVKNLDQLKLDFQNQFIILITDQLKSSLEYFQNSVKQILENNVNLQYISLNTVNFALPKMHDIYHEYKPIQFTNFFPSQNYSQLTEYEFYDCTKSGLSNYSNYPADQVDIQTYKTNQMLKFFSLNPQISKLLIQEVFIDTQFLLEFSQVIRKMYNLKDLNIKFYQKDEKQVIPYLFNDLPSLEKVDVCARNLAQYIELFQQKNVKEATIKDSFNQQIDLSLFLLTFKVQRLTIPNYGELKYLKKPNNFIEEEFPRIITLKQGGSELFDAVPSLIITAHPSKIQRMIKSVILHSIAFQSIIKPFLIYSPQQILYDLFD